MTGGHTVDNERFFEDGGAAYEVRPAGSEVVGGVLFLHWFDGDAVDGNRTQFLAEAEELAGQGVASVLPQLLFPWASDPTNAADDASRIESEVKRRAAPLTGWLTSMLPWYLSATTSGLCMACC